LIERRSSEHAEMEKHAFLDLNQRPNRNNLAWTSRASDLLL
jgi:hypothetical protein